MKHKPLNFTFGCPKIGNIFFKELANNYIVPYRFTTKYDIIPRLPLFYGYTHICDKMIIMKGRIIQNNNKFGLFNISSILFANIFSHKIDNYIKQLL